MKPMDMPRVIYDAISLSGGLDQITPTLSLKPGVVRNSVNFEAAVTGGYTRIGGYERYDGQAAPSAATYTILGVTLSGTVALNMVINGQTSGATATIIATPTGYLVVTARTGTFTVGENIRDGATVVGVCTSTTNSSSNAQSAAVYSTLAAAYYRALIDPVPGEGPVRGVVYFGGTVYAFRNAVGGASCVLHKSSASGWQTVTLFKEVTFTAGGTATPVEGQVLTQGGVTATIHRVVKRAGARTGTAAGTTVIATPGGGNFAAGAATVSVSGATLTLSGIQTQITLSPSGRYEMVVENFGSGSKIYGCDGVNPGFEFDGTVYAPIHTGMTVDTPDHVVAFKKHLIYAFDASVQIGGIGDPFGWTVVLGAAEISAGETITNYTILTGSQADGALLVQTRNNTQILYGSSTADFKLVNYNNGVGALAYMSANLAGAYTLDDRGVVGLTATLAYGNFTQASLSANIRPFILANRQYATACAVNREKSQFRLFFSNGNGLYCTIVNNKFIGAMPVYFPDPVFCTWEGEESDGTEITLCGSSGGYVHRLDAGTSFDGTAINSYITLNYNSMKSPRLLKRFRKASAEITGSTFAALNVSYSLGYGSPLIAPQASASYSANYANVTWDSGYTWDSGLVWDGRTLFPSEVELQGTAENIAIAFSNYTDYTASFTINSLIIHYTPRRGIR